MRINVSQQLKASIGTVRNYKTDEAVDITSSKSVVRGEFNLTRTDQSILAKGSLKTEIEVTCSRCLKYFTCPLHLDIEEEYFPVTDVVTGVPIDLPEEPGYFTIDEHHIIDLNEAVRQYATLAVPMKPLCREDCAGLCLKCGYDLNQGSCRCPPQETDPRWSELSKLAVAGDAQMNETRKTE